MSTLLPKMRRGSGRGKAIVAAVVREVRAENITFMAGSIAYHAFVSILPFLLLMLWLLSRLGSREAAVRLLTAMAGYLGPEQIDEVVDIAVNATNTASLSVISLAVLVWGALRIFRGLDTAFSDIYESESRNDFADQLRDGVVVFLAVGSGVFLVSVAERAIGLPALGTAALVVRPVITVLAVTIALLPMFYIFPDERVTVREVVPGTVVAAIGWTALGKVFQFYAGVSANSEYGVVGIVILVITWLYFTGFVLLLGASVNAVLAGRSEDVSNIAWGEAEDPTANDAAFVAPLRELDGAFSTDEDVGIESGATTVVLPPPHEADISITTVDRPSVLGGDRERGRLVLRWDSWVKES